MMIQPMQNSAVVYNQQFYANDVDTVYMANAVPAQGSVQILQPLKNGSPSSNSTWTGNDLDSVGSGDSCWENSPHMGSPQMHAQQQMYRMPEGSVPQQKLEQGQDQQQPYFMPVPMVQTQYGYMPLQRGSPMGQQSPMGSQGTPMAMPALANSPVGMTMMQAVPAMPNAEASTQANIQMQQMVSPASPQGMMMQPIPSANGDGMQMIAVVPAGMAMPGMGMQAIAMAPPQGYMYKPVSETSQTTTPSTTGEKKMRLLEDLLPGGVRRKAVREECGRKVFVGGLNPTTTTEDLTKYFGEFGAVSHSCVITDSSSKASRGFGFVEFEEKIPEGVLDQQHTIDQRRCSVREYGLSNGQTTTQ